MLLEGGNSDPGYKGDENGLGLAVNGLIGPLEGNVGNFTEGPSDLLVVSSPGCESLAMTVATWLEVRVVLASLGLSS